MATFKSSGTDKDVKVQPTGTGKVVVGTGAAAATVASDGDNDLVLQTGNATTGSITITDGANGNIAITPNGTGEVALPKVNIDGGAIDGVTIGGSSPGAVTTSSLVATTADINGGTIDGTTIATSDITVGSGKTLDVSEGTLTLANDQISGDAIAGGSASLASLNVTANSASEAVVITQSSTGDALRITQTGTGNALVVEDDTNPDSTPFVVDATGKVFTGESIEINYDSSGTKGNRYAIIDLHGDDVNSDYGLRIIRLNSGENANSAITHKGTGTLSLGTEAAGDVSFSTNNTERVRISSGGKLIKYGDSSSARIIPQTDTVGYIGEASARWNTIYAQTNTINTSDENEKQDIEALSEAELNVAAAIKGLIKKYRWKDAVIEKGDDARIHVGVIAQEIKAAFEAEGLDAHRYGMFCSDTWYEVDGESTDANGVAYTVDSEGAVAKTRLGVRYEELLAFVIAAL